MNSSTLFTLRHKGLSVSNYQRLRSQTGWASVSDDLVRESFARHWYCVHAVDKAGVVIGVARIIGDPMYAYLQDVIVDKKFRRQGVGRALVKDLLTFLSIHGSPQGFVGLMAAKDTRFFYELLGFNCRALDAPGMQLAVPVRRRRQ